MELTIGVIEFSEKTESMNVNALMTDKLKKAMKNAATNRHPASALLTTINASLFNTTTSPEPNSNLDNGQANIPSQMIIASVYISDARNLLHNIFVRDTGFVSNDLIVPD